MSSAASGDFINSAVEKVNYSQMDLARVQTQGEEVELLVLTVGPGFWPSVASVGRFAVGASTHGTCCGKIVKVELDIDRRYFTKLIP